MYMTREETQRHDELLNTLVDAAETGLVYAEWCLKSGIYPHTEMTGKLRALPRLAVLTHVKRIKDAVGEHKHGGRLPWLLHRISQGETLTAMESEELTGLVEMEAAHAS